MIALTLLLLAMSPHTARGRAIGETVTVEGYVTVQSGVFGSFMGDNGFVLGNAVTGLYVATNQKAYRSMGTALEVHGELENRNGLLVLRARDIRLGKGRSLVRPRKIALSEVDELREGQIVEVEGTLARPAVNDLPAGFKLFLKGDGAETQIFVPGFIKVDSFAVGSKLRVVGWCGQYGKTYEVVVRKDKDIQLK